MLKDTLISVRFADCRELPKTPTPGAVRAYHSAPGIMTLQIRSQSPTTDSGRGKVRNMIANAPMSPDEVRQLRDALNAFLAYNGDPAFKLAQRVARLNPDAGEIGPGMLASLVADARAIVGGDPCF